MLHRIRLVARVLAALVVPLAIGGFALVATEENPAYAYRWSGADGDERYAEDALRQCEAVGAARGVARLVASAEIAAATTACEEMRASTAPPLDRAEMVRRPISKVGTTVDEARLAVFAYAAAVAVGAILAALGLGRVGAGMLLTSFLLAYYQDLLPQVVAGSVPPALLFLACASWTEPRTPSDRTAAWILTLGVVPITAGWMALHVLSIGSGRSDVRLNVAAVIVAIAWATTGIPLGVLVQRMPDRKLVPSIGILALGLATAFTVFVALAG
jgi:hypothetical protein